MQEVLNATQSKAGANAICITWMALFGPIETQPYQNLALFGLALYAWPRAPSGATRALFEHYSAFGENVEMDGVGHS